MLSGQRVNTTGAGGTIWEAVGSYTAADEMIEDRCGDHPGASGWEALCYKEYGIKLS